MGYSISDELKTKYLAREPQICNIRVDFLSSATQPGSRTYIILTDEDIVSQGLNIDRALFTGNTLELGTAISAESTISLNNSDGRFDKFHFEGAKLQIYVGLRSDGRNSSAGTAGGRVKSVSDDGNTVTVDTIRNIVNAVPMGTFWVDNCPRRTKRITLSCLDSFAKMDLVIPSSGHGISTSSVALYEMISQICSKIGLTLYVTTGNSFATYLQSLFPNTYNKQVVLPQIDGKLTYRALFQYCIQMLGGYAFMDWDNKVHIAKYGSSAISPTITAAQRYTSDIQENSISVTGVSVTYKDNEDSEQTSLYGTTDYAISISGNPLITPDNVSGIAQSVKSQTFESWQYYPFSVKCKPMLWLYPLDKVSVINQSGTSVSSYVTNTNFTLNGTMVIESKGETQYEKGWASSNAFTAKQTAIIEAVAKQNTSDLRQKYQDVLNLNEMLAKSMGLWTKIIDGKYYFYTLYGSSSTTAPDFSSIDLSYGSGHIGKDVIYTFNSGGLGVATSFDGTIQTQSDRNNLDTETEVLAKLVWSYGVTSDGNAVLNRIRAYTISADYIKTGKLSSFNNSTYFDLTNSEICTTGSSGDNNFKTYFRGGDIEFFGSVSNGALGKTAKMRTGYEETENDGTKKHFAIGYISNTTDVPNDGANSLLLGAFDAGDDHFINMFQLNAPDGANFGTSVLPMNVKTKNGHFESNILNIAGEVIHGIEQFSVGLKHSSAHHYPEGSSIDSSISNTYNAGKNTSGDDVPNKFLFDGNRLYMVRWKNPATESTYHKAYNDGDPSHDQIEEFFDIDYAKRELKFKSYPTVRTVLIIYSYTVAWRNHYFGSYIDANGNHWTGLQAYNSDGDFLHRVTSIKNNNIVYFRIEIPGGTNYISIDVENNRIALRQSYGSTFSYSNALDLYCKDIYCSNITVNGSNVYSNLTNLWTDKANVSITGTGKVSDETHYQTLVRHNDRLSEFWTMLKSTDGRIKVGLYKPAAPGEHYSTLLSLQDGSAYYGTIACSSASNFAFYKGQSTSTLADIYAHNINSGSTEDSKKNITESKTNALSLLEHSKIYNYDYKNDEDLKNDGKKSAKFEEETLGSNLGFVIGRETPEEVISEDGTAVNLYSFTSLTWLACQQLLERIKTLEARVDELENPS